MTVTLDGKTLTVTKWGEGVQPIQSLYDRWSGGVCKRKKHVYGLVRTYTLDCVEKDVAWASSLVNYFEEKASAGTAVAFTSDLPQRTLPANTYVTVESVDFIGENVGTQNIRKFTLQLMEA
jgi:hypothetical protein